MHCFPWRLLEHSGKKRQRDSHYAHRVSHLVVMKFVGHSWGLSSDTAPHAGRIESRGREVGAWLFSSAKNVSITFISQQHCLLFQTQICEMALWSKVAPPLEFPSFIPRPSLF